MDLSHHHQPIGQFARRDDDWSLTDDQVAFFHENGYLGGVPLLDGDQVEQLRAELHELTSASDSHADLWYEFHSNESASPDLVLFHALGAWRITAGFHDLLWHPRFVTAAEQLLGGDVRFWHDQLFCKPAKHGGVVAWHQDYSYWTRTRPMSHLTCWVALDDVDADNGGVSYVPGSHRWPLLPITGLAGDMDSIREVLDDDQWSQFNSPVVMEMPAGHCSFHHPLMVHGSFENRTERSRRATVINVFRDGVCSDSDEELLQGVPVIPSGQPMGGQFFPLLSRN